jgi:hypothetical protein
MVPGPTLVRTVVRLVGTRKGRMGAMIDYEGATVLDWLALVGAGSVLGVPVEWVTCFGGLVGVIHVDPVDAEPLLRVALDSAESRLRPSIGSPATLGEWVAAAVSDPTVVPLLQALTPPGRWSRPGSDDVAPLGWVDRETGRGGIVPVFGRSTWATASAKTLRIVRARYASDMVASLVCERRDPECAGAMLDHLALKVPGQGHGRVAGADPVRTWLALESAPVTAGRWRGQRVSWPASGRWTRDGGVVACGPTRMVAWRGGYGLGVGPPGVPVERGGVRVAER